MNIIQAGILGLVQGLTEFLPVSSSGHLVLTQSFIPDFSQPGVLFDAYLHFGTLLAVLVFYFKRILKLDFNYIKVLVLASIPAVIVGFLLKDYIDVIFQNTKLVGIALLFSGIMNIKTDTHKETTDTITTKKGFFVGLFQAFAILPGISRSGSTIFAGTLTGIKKEKAAEFSFLLSVPAVLGANVLEILKSGGGAIFSTNYIVGIICSFIAGIVCIKLLLNILSNSKLKYFGYYCIVVGLLAILLI
jgi:undecaprenyl-diphosphatase